MKIMKNMDDMDMDMDMDMDDIDMDDKTAIFLGGLIVFGCIIVLGCAIVALGFAVFSLGFFALIAWLIYVLIKKFDFN